MAAVRVQQGPKGPPAQWCTACLQVRPRRASRPCRPCRHLSLPTRVAPPLQPCQGRQRRGRARRRQARRQRAARPLGQRRQPGGRAGGGQQGGGGGGGGGEPVAAPGAHRGAVAGAGAARRWVLRGRCGVLWGGRRREASAARFNARQGWACRAGPWPQRPPPRRSLPASACSPHPTHPPALPPHPALTPCPDPDSERRLDEEVGSLVDLLLGTAPPPSPHAYAARSRSVPARLDRLASAGLRASRSRAALAPAAPAAPAAAARPQPADAEAGQAGGLPEPGSPGGSSDGLCMICMDQAVRVQVRLLTSWLACASPGRTWMVIDAAWAARLRQQAGAAACQAALSLPSLRC